MASTSHAPGGAVYRDGWVESTYGMTQSYSSSVSHRITYKGYSTSGRSGYTHRSTLGVTEGSKSSSSASTAETSQSSEYGETVTGVTHYNDNCNTYITRWTANGSAYEDTKTSNTGGSGPATWLKLFTTYSNATRQTTKFEERFFEGSDLVIWTQSYLDKVATSGVIGGHSWPYVAVGDSSCRVEQQQTPYPPITAYTTQYQYSASQNYPSGTGIDYDTFVVATTGGVVITVTTTTNYTLTHLTATTKAGSSISNMSTYLAESSNPNNISTRSSVGYLPLQYSAAGSTYAGTNYRRTLSESQVDIEVVDYSTVTASQQAPRIQDTVVFLTGSLAGNSVLWSYSATDSVGLFSDIFRSVAGDRLTIKATAKMGTSVRELRTISRADTTGYVSWVTFTKTNDFGNGTISSSNGSAYATYKTVRFDYAQSRNITTTRVEARDLGRVSYTYDVRADLSAGTYRATDVVTKVSSRTATDVALLAVTGSEAYLFSTYVVEYYKLYTVTETSSGYDPNVIPLLNGTSKTESAAGSYFDVFPRFYTIERAAESKLYPQEDFRIINKVFNAGYAGFGGSWKDHSELSIYRSVSFAKLTGDLPDGWAGLSSTDLCSASAFSGATFFPTVDTVTGKKFRLSYDTVSSMSSQVTISMIFATTSQTTGVSAVTTTMSNQLNGLLTHRAGSDMTVGVDRTSRSYSYEGWSTSSTTLSKDVFSTVKYRAYLAGLINKDYYERGSVFAALAEDNPVILAGVTYGRAGELSPDDSTMFFPSCVLRYTRTDYAGSALQTFESATTLSNSNDILSLTFPKSNNICFECHPLISVSTRSNSYGDVWELPILETPKYVFDLGFWSSDPEDWTYEDW